MPTFSVALASNSTNGKVIPVVATATPGTPFHTAIAGSNSFDEVFVWASNVTNAAVSLTIEWGGTGVGNHIIDTYSIPANSPMLLIVPGIRVNGAVLLAAYAGTTNAINLAVNVNAIR